MKQIKNIEELKAECEESADFFIILGGYARSSKRIEWNGQEDRFYIYNEIDDTEQVLSEEQLLNKDYTLVGEAMRKGALYKY